MWVTSGWTWLVWPGDLVIYSTLFVASSRATLWLCYNQLVIWYNHFRLIFQQHAGSSSCRVWSEGHQLWSGCSIEGHPRIDHKDTICGSLLLALTNPSRVNSPFLLFESPHFLLIKYWLVWKKGTVFTNLMVNHHFSIKHIALFMGIAWYCPSFRHNQISNTTI